MMEMEEDSRGNKSSSSSSSVKDVKSLAVQLHAKTLSDQHNVAYKKEGLASIKREIRKVERALEKEVEMNKEVKRAHENTLGLLVQTKEQKMFLSALNSSLHEKIKKLEDVIAVETTQIYQLTNQLADNRTHAEEFEREQNAQRERSSLRKAKAKVDAEKTIKLQNMLVGLAKNSEDNFRASASMKMGILAFTQEKGDVELQLSNVRRSMEKIELEHTKALQEVDDSTKELTALSKLTRDREQQEACDKEKLDKQKASNKVEMESQTKLISGLEQEANAKERMHLSLEQERCAKQNDLEVLQQTHQRSEDTLQQIIREREEARMDLKELQMQLEMRSNDLKRRKSELEELEAGEEEEDGVGDTAGCSTAATEEEKRAKQKRMSSRRNHARTLADLKDQIVSAEKLTSSLQEEIKQLEAVPNPVVVGDLFGDLSDIKSIDQAQDVIQNDITKLKDDLLQQSTRMKETERLSDTIREKSASTISGLQDTIAGAKQEHATILKECNQLQTQLAEAKKELGIKNTSIEANKLRACQIRQSKEERDSLLKQKQILLEGLLTTKDDLEKQLLDEKTANENLERKILEATTEKKKELIQITVDKEVALRVACGKQEIDNEFSKEFDKIVEETNTADQHFQQVFIENQRNSDALKTTFQKKKDAVILKFELLSSMPPSDVKSMDDEEFLMIPDMMLSSSPPSPAKTGDYDGNTGVTSQQAEQNRDRLGSGMEDEGGGTSGDAGGSATAVVGDTDTLSATPCPTAKIVPPPPVNSSSELEEGHAGGSCALLQKDEGVGGCAGDSSSTAEDYDGGATSSSTNKVIKETATTTTVPQVTTTANNKSKSRGTRKCKGSTRPKKTASKRSSSRSTTASSSKQ